MQLLDDLRSVLTRHHAHASAQTNQGAVRLIEDHLKRLEGATTEADAHAVLSELYGALNAPSPEAPAVPAKATAKKAAPAAETAA